MNRNITMNQSSAPVPAGAEELKKQALFLIMQLPPLERESILRDYRIGPAVRHIS